MGKVFAKIWAWMKSGDSEKICLIEMIILVAVAFGIDIPLRCLRMHELWQPAEGLSETMGTIFGAAVTLGTLGITVLTLVSQISDRELYGLNLAQYFVRIRPEIFKSIRCIYFELLLSALGVAALLTGFYACVVALFLCTTAIIWIMVKNLADAFGDSVDIEEKVKEYCISVLTQETENNFGTKRNAKLAEKAKLAQKRVLEGLAKDSKRAVEGNNTEVFKNDIDVLFEAYFGSLNNNIKIKIYDTMIAEYKYAFEKGNQEIIINAITLLTELYQKNRESRNGESIPAWDILFYYYNEATKRLSFKYAYQNLKSFVCLYIELLLNFKLEVNSDQDKKIINVLEYFFSSMYTSIIYTNRNTEETELVYELKFRIYNAIIHVLTDDLQKYDDAQTTLHWKAAAFYIKGMIDKCDFDILKEHVLKKEEIRFIFKVNNELSDYEKIIRNPTYKGALDNEKDCLPWKTTLQLIIYLFYLAETSAYRQDENIETYRGIIIECRTYLCFILQYCFINSVYKQIFSSDFYKLDTQWEKHSKQYSYDCLQTRSDLSMTTQWFYIFSLMYFCTSKKDMYKKLTEETDKDYYDSIFSIFKYEGITEYIYDRFLKLYFNIDGRKQHQYVEERYNQMKWALNKIIKQQNSEQNS